jgi:DNA polymerase epsilon subunit 1
MYLPELAAEYFDNVVNEFLLMPYEYKERLNQITASQNIANSQSEAYMTPESRRSKFNKYLQDLVTGHFQQRLCQVVGELTRHYQGDERAGEASTTDFPVLPGSHLPLHNPALEFIKCVVHVLSLDSNVTDQAIRLKESLMKLLRIKAYSEEAKFKDLCLTYVLPDVICSFCNACRDVDLCRDPVIINKEWLCNICDHRYDTSLVEAMLVNVVTRRSVAYQVQDLVCTSCNSIKMATTSLYCECSGRYVCKTTKEDFFLGMKAFMNIAKYYGFTWLEETVAWIQQTTVIA